jgi:transcription elongation factor Elf1
VINSIYSVIISPLTADLSAPIDVYSDWIDAAEAVGREGRAAERENLDEYADDGLEV